MMRADCQRCREQMDDYLSSELLVETTREVLRHASGCAECREELDRRQALRQMLRQALSTDIPDSIEPRLLAALTAAQQAAKAASSGLEAGLPLASPRAVGEIPPRNQLGKVLKHWGHKLSELGRAWIEPALWSSWVRQTAGVAVVCMLALAAAWYVGVGTRVSAAELLQRSSDAERTLLTAPDVSLHRVLTFEERAVPSGRFIRRQRIEIWHDSRRGVTARRVFTEANQLVAGEWTNRGGDGTVFRRGSPPELTSSTSVSARAASLVTGGQLWRMGLTAEEFESLIPSGATADVRTTATEYEVTFVNASADRDDPIRRASVTLTRPGLRPVRQALFVGAGDDSREYRFSEREFATVSSEQVAQAVYEPDPELTWLVAVPLDIDVLVPLPRPGSRTDARLFDPPHVDPILEIDVLHRLHRIEACVRERAELVRGDDGVLTVRVVTASEYRHAQVLDALTPMADNPYVSIDVTLTTPDAAAQPPARLGPRTVMPAYDPLRRYFLDFVLRRLPPDTEVAVDDLHRSIDGAIDRLA
ncbi:MAG: hypothetical protein Q7V01_09170, partial [Vicinamibacterales bacterium]|nr:hypothetical protein [Vicinamibacterales bacterium]